MTVEVGWIAKVLAAVANGIPVFIITPGGVELLFCVPAADMLQPVIIAKIINKQIKVKILDIVTFFAWILLKIEFYHPIIFINPGNFNLDFPFIEILFITNFLLLNCIHK